MRVDEFLAFDGYLLNILIDAASDAYCALQAYDRIRDIGRERKVDVDVMTLLDGGLKLKRNVADSMMNDLTPESINSMPKSGAPRPVPRQVAATTSEGGKKGLTRQQARAYALWHEAKKPLDEICAELRSPENPLKRSTVM